MEHGQQDAEPIGTILSGIATLLRELSDQLDIAAARVDDSTDLDARLKKLESWAATAGQDITSLQTRMEKVESSEVRTAVAARPTRAERREAAERAELEAAASRGETATSTGRVSSTPASGTPSPASAQASSDPAALTSAKDDESAGTTSTSIESDRKTPTAEAPEAPPRLAPIPRLPAPDIAVAPTGTSSVPEKSEQQDAAGSDRPASLAGGTTEATPSRRLPRANFPRRQPVRAESDGIGSSLLGGSGRLGKSGPDSGSLLGDSSLDHGADAESPAIVADDALVNNALADNAVGGETVQSTEPQGRKRDKGVDDDAPQAEESIGARGGVARLGSPTALVRTGDSTEIDSTEINDAEDDSEDEPVTRIGRRSVGAHGVTDTATVGDSEPSDSPRESEAESVPQPALPAELPERVPAGGSRLPRRAAAYSPSAANGDGAGEPAAPHTPSRAERRRLAEADTAFPDSASGSAHAAPDRVPAPSNEADRAARSLSSDADSGDSVTSAHSKPESRRTESRYAIAGETADRPDAARVEAASTAETVGPAARALGITAAAVPETVERSRRGGAMSEAAAKQLADGDAPATEVIPALSALRHLGSDSDAAEEGPSTALPQRGSRRADRREAVELERLEGTPDVGARPHSHGAEADDENLPRHDTGDGLPQRGPGSAHRHRDAASLPERETGDSLPTRHSSGSHSQSDPADGFPQRDSAPGLPQRDSGAGISRRDHGSELPQRSTGNRLPPEESVNAPAHPEVGAPSQRETGSTLPTRDAGNSLPPRDASGAMPQRDAGSSLPQRGTSHALPGRDAGHAPAQDETGQTLQQRGMHSTQLDAAEVPASHEVSHSLPTRDAGAGGTLPRRDPGHSAPPRDAVAEISSDVPPLRSAGRHNNGDDRETEDLLVGSAPRMRPSDHTDSPARDDAGSPQSDQGDARFGGARPADSPTRDSWQRELDRLAAETAYADDSDPGDQDRQIASVGRAALPRRGDGPAGVTRRVEPAGITPRPAPVQPNPFGPPTSSLTTGIDEPAHGDMPFDLDPPASRPQVSTPEVAEQAPSGKQRPTIEDNAHVDKLQAMLDELKRNPAGPFGRATNTPPENSGH